MRLNNLRDDSSRIRLGTVAPGASSQIMWAQWLLGRHLTVREPGTKMAESLFRSSRGPKSSHGVDHRGFQGCSKELGSKGEDDWSIWGWAAGAQRPFTERANDHRPRVRLPT